MWVTVTDYTYGDNLATWIYSSPCIFAFKTYSIRFIKNLIEKDDAVFQRQN